MCGSSSKNLNPFSRLQSRHLSCGVTKDLNVSTVLESPMCALFLVSGTANKIRKNRVRDDDFVDLQIANTIRHRAATPSWRVDDHDDI
mmetsp:Transcript_5815/g.14767  ORF Transcript_5815/g.14767 Transcript_5815/m.14767 type:complete len:88 (+) Transcript_5815:4040-4303(+)